MKAEANVIVLAIGMMSITFSATTNSKDNRSLRKISLAIRNMNRFIMRTSIISLFFLLFSVITATAEPMNLSLRDAIAMALERNNHVRAAEFRSRAGQEGVGVAASLYYPGIFFDEAFTASNSPTRVFMMKLDQGRFAQNDFLIDNLNHPASQHDFRTAITILQPLYTPSASPYRALAAAEADRESAGLDATREEIAFQVFSSFLEIRKAEARLKAQEQAIAEARENLRLARVRNREGVGLKSDELRAGTHLSSVEQQLVTSRNNLVLAKMRLAIVLGLKEDAEIEISGSSTGFAAVLSPEELTRLALENRKDLRQSKYELEKAGASVKLAKSAYLPEVGAFASYQMNSDNTPLGSDNDAWMTGLNLKWQIFDGFRRNHATRQALAGRSAAAEMLEAGQKEIRFQVRESLLRLEETGKRLEMAKNAQKDAEETVRLLSRRFENSLATMVELLDAQTALNQARASLVETGADHDLTGGRVYFTAGIFLKEIMK